MTLHFHPLSLADQHDIRSRVSTTECRNCDLNFVNLYAWRFLYDTEVAFTDAHLLFRFRADGHLAYLPPVGPYPCPDVLTALMADAAAHDAPFLMLGACEAIVEAIHASLPDHFYAKADRAFSDYLYSREQFATFGGKKLQAKRNFVNRFTRQFPDYEFVPLTASLMPECLALDERWTAQKTADASEAGRYTYEAERQALQRVAECWDELEVTGAALRVDGCVVAFTYGAPINHDTFDICAEKADTRYEGAFATMARDFARSLPPQYVLLNREEDLGIEGLRQSKLSYRPVRLLDKYTLMTKHPLGC